MIASGVILDGVYQIIQEIGQGGTGIIYLAEHLRLNKRVIVKKIKDHFVGQVNGREEVDILKRLHHSYLPQVYDFLVIGGSIYTVMEYIEGNDMQYYLDRKYLFPEETVRQWLLQLAEVLEYLHGQRPPILHSDIKPGNIMITRAGHICLIDFNISLDGEDSKDLQGISPWYAAPEQYEKARHMLQGEKDHIALDGRMDIYSLGATFYRVMTGNLPSPTEDQSAALIYMDVPYSDGLKMIVSKMLKRRPSGRYASARKLREALEHINRMDPVYRRYGYMQAGVGIVWALCVIAGVLCIYYGNWQHTVEEWRQAYQSLYIMSERQDETSIISEGTRMLNDFSYRSYLKKNADAKAEVLNMIGESYFRQEQFSEAAAYYKEAWELEEAEENYCENYVIALIRSGQTEKARQIAQSMEGRRALSEEKQKLISAEILWESKDMENAREILEEIAADSERTGDAGLLSSADSLLADIYVEQGEYAKAVDILETAAQAGTEKEVKRKLAEAAYLAAQASDRTVNRNSYLNKALENYTSLNYDANPSYEDRLNLALVERALGKHEDSNRTLKEMLSEYPDEYILPMWMCYNYLDLAKEQDSFEGIKEDLKFRYQDACHIYKALGTQDEDMEQLIEIVDGLEE